MVALRVVRTSYDSLNVPSLRVVRSAYTGLVVASPPSLRVVRTAYTGTVAIALNAIAAQTVEPGVTVTLTAVLTGGGTADSYLWRVASGDTVTLSTATNVATFTSPSVVDASKVPRQAVTTIGVTATVSGVTSAERTVIVTTLPQNRWTLNAARQFVGVTRLQLP